jgi:hypothetical protein
MPRLTVWFVRSSLMYLLLGFTLGALMLWNKGAPIHPLLWRLLPAHMEFLLLGWTLQLAMGVAFWILPRFMTKRGNVKLAWAAFVLLNLGVWLAGVGPVLGAPAWVTVLGRGAELGAAATFTLHAWPRVKPLMPEASSSR